MRILSDSKFSPKEYKHIRPRVYPGQIPSYIEVNTQDFYRFFAFVKGKTVPFPLLCSVESTGKVKQAVVYLKKIIVLMSEKRGLGGVKGLDRGCRTNNISVAIYC